MAGRPANKKGANKAASAPPAQTNNKRKSNLSKEPSSKKAKVAPVATKASGKAGKKSTKAATPGDDSEDDESWAYGAVSGSDDSDIEEMDDEFVSAEEGSDIEVGALDDDFLGDEFAGSDEESKGPGAAMFGSDDEGDEEEQGEEEEDEEDIFASDSEDSENDDMETKSRKLDAAAKAEAEEAEAELQTNIMLESDKYVLPGEDNEILQSTDLQVVQARIQEIVRVLNNFREMREGNRSRNDYISQLLKDLCLYYGYNEYLMEKLFYIFPVSEAIEFFEANEVPRPVTIRTNTLKTRRRELAQALINRGVNLDS
ncbi:rRNA (cytosine-C5-)-methyltransferase nop2, partial [Mortierella sp. AD031]